MTTKPDPLMLTRLENAVRSLPDIEREVFLAVRLDGLSYAAIAARTGRSASEIERRFAAALSAIQRTLDEGGGP